jgi:hypothetical protein
MENIDCTFNRLRRSTFAEVEHDIAKKSHELATPTGTDGEIVICISKNTKEFSYKDSKTMQDICRKHGWIFEEFNAEFTKVARRRLNWI